MKRKIEFRGRDTEDGTWVFGSLLSLGDRCQIVSVANGNTVYHDVAPDTVGQLIGVDGCHIPVFEGDIYINSCDIEDFERSMRAIVYDESHGTFLGTRGYGLLVSLPDLRLVQVVGNIHENAYLLHDEKE